MSGEDTIFSEYVALDNLPHWPCPNCAKGVLLQGENGFTSHLSAASQAEKHNWAWEPDWDRRHFSLHLECNVCKEAVFCIGDQRYEPDYDEAPYQYYKVLKPQYFHPSLSFVALPENCPSGCRRAIQDACKLLWASPAAAANALRRAVELFLDDQKVEKTKAVQKGEKAWERRLTLDERLKIFAATRTDKPWLDTLLQPVRIIGNAGSHEWDPEMRKSLVECFPLIEYVLEEFYHDRNAKLARLQNIGDGIIKGRGVTDTNP